MLQYYRDFFKVFAAMMLFERVEHGLCQGGWCALLTRTDSVVCSSCVSFSCCWCSLIHAYQQTTDSRYCHRTTGRRKVASIILGRHVRCTQGIFSVLFNKSFRSRYHFIHCRYPRSPLFFCFEPTILFYFAVGWVWPG